VSTAWQAAKTYARALKLLVRLCRWGYAEYICPHEGFVTPIPDNIDSERAASLFCPGITAYKAVKASEPATGRSVGIFGIGGVGHLAIELAKVHGARVVAASRTKKHLDFAEKLVADNTIVFQDSQERFLKYLKKEEGLLDSAIVFAPSDNAIMPLSSQSRREG
jgi:propanol-preferring alcohol dehydrogenase